MSQALYRKWRPARFGDVIGQEHVTRTLQNSVAAERVGHAYLFCGPRGTGKTTLARLLAKAVNCLHADVTQRPCNQCHVCTAIGDGRFLDLIEIDAASNTGVDDIRDLRDKINFAPNEGRFKVYIIDEVHMLSTAAFNALLKTLEEPPPHAKFVLATTEEHKVPLTIKSRCQQFNFRLLTAQEIIGRLNWIAAQESLTAEPEALALIAQHGAGSLRDAESLLDQLVGGPNDVITVERVQMVLGTAGGDAIAALADAILAADGPEGLHLIHAALATGADARQFCRQMVVYLRRLLLLQTAGNAVGLNVTAEQQAGMEAQARHANRQLLLKAIKNFNEGATTAATSWQPQLPLELAFIESLPDEPVQPPLQPVPQTARGETPPQAQPAPPAAGRQEAQPAAPAPEKAEAEQTEAPEPTPRPAEADQEKETPAQPVPAAQSEPALTLNQIKGKTWREFVAKAGQRNRNLKIWLNSSVPLAVEGNLLVIAPNHDFLIAKIEAVRDDAAAALSEVLGGDYSIKCVDKDDYVSPAAPNLRAEVEALADELGGVVREIE